MAQIAILENTNDPFYRYRMPRPIVKLVGKGKGKTVLSNIAAIARALNRPPCYLTNYFGLELKVKVCLKSGHTLHGVHNADTLLNLIYGFVGKFVLCPKCNNPETSLSVMVNAGICQDCIACGHSCEIPKSVHKLTAYIINNPPETTNFKERKLPTTNSEAFNENKSFCFSLADENDEDNDDAFDEEDLSVSAYLERLQNNAHGFFMNDPEMNVEVFRNFLKRQQKNNSMLDVNVQEDIFRQAELLEIKDKATLVLGEFLFTENILQDIVTYGPLFRLFCDKNQNSQEFLLAAFEKIVAGQRYGQTLLPQANQILKRLCEELQLDKAVVFKWADKEPEKCVDDKKKIREKIAPFIKWLKETSVDNNAN
jgi:translation initiation factor 5